MRCDVKALSACRLVASPLTVGGTLGVILLVAGTGIASAGDIYRDRATFLAATDAVSTEGFESFPTYTNCSSGGPSPVTSLTTELFTVTTTPRDGGTAFLCTGTHAIDDPHPTEGNNALVAGSNTGDTWFLDFSLNASTNAVGLDITDLAETGDVMFYTDTGESALVQTCCLPSGSEVFFGYASDQPFNSFRMENNGRGDGWGVDQVSIGHAASDPGTLLRQLHEDVTGVGPGKSLANKVALAQTYYAVPDRQATCAVLTGFVNEVRAQRGKKIAPNLADKLTADA